MHSHMLRLVFLPKNATSKLQLLDAEITKNFKVFYRKLLLHHVLVRILPESKASDCLGNGSTELSQKRDIINSFAKYGFRNQILESYDDKKN